MQAQAPSAAPTPADRFAAIMDALCRAMANQANARRLAGPLVVLIWSRLRRLAARFAVSLRRPPTAARAPDRRDRRTREPGTPLPRNFGWLRRLLPGMSATAAQLDHLLADPAMTALLAANPATGRVIRPLCHLLGLRPPPTLRLPPRPAAPTPRQPVPRRAARRTPAPPAAAATPEPRAPARRHGHIAMPAPYLVPLRL